MFLTPIRKRQENGNRSLFPVLGLRSEIDRMFDSFLREPFGAMTNVGGAAGWSPAVELSETEKEFNVRAELPGIKPEEIEVSIMDNALVLSGEKREKTEKKEENYHFSETFYGSFRRSIPLPAEVDEDSVEAEYTDGVLNVRLKKIPEAQPKKIQVKAGKSETPVAGKVQTPQGGKA